MGLTATTARRQGETGVPLGASTFGRRCVPRLRDSLRGRNTEGRGDAVAIGCYGTGTARGEGWWLRATRILVAVYGARRVRAVVPLARASSVRERFMTTVPRFVTMLCGGAAASSRRRREGGRRIAQFAGGTTVRQWGRGAAHASHLWIGLAGSGGAHCGPSRVTCNRRLRAPRVGGGLAAAAAGRDVSRLRWCAAPHNRKTPRTLWPGPSPLHGRDCWAGVGVARACSASLVCLPAGGDGVGWDRRAGSEAPARRDDGRGWADVVGSPPSARSSLE